MAYDYNLFLDKIKSTLVANATALAASLSVNYPTLTSDSIAIGAPENLPRGIDRYPYIIINAKNTDEEFEQLGVSSTGIARTVNNSVALYSFINVMSDSQDSDKQARTLARNINTVFRANYEISGADGWDKVIAETTIHGKDAYKEPGQDDVYTSATRIELSFTKYNVS